MTTGWFVQGFLENLGSPQLVAGQSDLPKLKKKKTLTVLFFCHVSLTNVRPARQSSFRTSRWPALEFDPFAKFSLDYLDSFKNVIMIPSNA